MNKVKTLNKKDLLGLKDLSLEEIELIFETAEGMREIFNRPIRRAPALVGKSIISLFYEPSTRTRTSFEMAAKMLSASTTNISAATSSMVKGETLLDTARNLEVMGADAIINVRLATSMVVQGAAELLAYGTAVKFR